MFDVDFNDLDLGSRNKPTRWLAVAPDVRSRQEEKQKRNALLTARCQSKDDASSKSSRSSTRSRRSQGAVPKPPPIVARPHDPRHQLKREALDPSLPWLPPEDEDGNVEYKLRLKEPSVVRQQQLITQMKYRLSEGAGECFYYVGVEDHGYLRGLSEDDLEASLATVDGMAATLCATPTLLKVFNGAKGRHCALVHIQRNTADEVSYTDLRIAVAGSVDSGKSTIVAVLTNGCDGVPLLDNGHGSARMNVFRHKHEIESGRTSSISRQMLGYDNDGNVLNYFGVARLTPVEISAAATKVLHFLDLGGHEKYLKTALYGLTCMLPDFTMLCISAAASFTRITHEHLAAAVALQVPVYVVVTKADAVRHDELARVVADVQHVVMAAAQSLDGQLTADDLQTMAPVVDSIEASEGAAAIMSSSYARNASGCPRLYVPIFLASSVSGQGVSMLHAFLSRLQPSAVPSVQHSDAPRNGAMARDDAAQFQVDHMFDVTNVGPVVSGTVTQGCIEVGQQLVLGPLSDGSFKAVKVKGIQRSQVPVKRARMAQTATLALEPTSTAAPSQPLPAAREPPCAVNQPSTHASCITGNNNSNDQLPCSSAAATLAAHAATAQAERSTNTATATVSSWCAAEQAPMIGSLKVDGGAASQLRLDPLGELHAAQPLTHTSAQHGGVSSPFDEQVVPASVISTTRQSGTHAVPHNGSTPPLQLAAGSLVAVESLNQWMSAPSCDNAGSSAQCHTSTSTDGHSAAEHASNVRTVPDVGSTCSNALDHAVQAKQGIASSSTCTPASGLHRTTNKLVAEFQQWQQVAATQNMDATTSSQPLDVATLSIDRNESERPQPSNCFMCMGSSLDSSLDAIHGGPLALHHIHPPMAVLQHSSSTASNLSMNMECGSQEPLRDSDAHAALPHAASCCAIIASASQPIDVGAAAARSSVRRGGGWGCLEGGEKLLSCSPPNARKGVMLMDAALRPACAWEFEAVLVLLSGHWPPRGLVSGRWPPEEGELTSETGHGRSASSGSGYESTSAACDSGNASPRQRATASSQDACWQSCGSSSRRRRRSAQYYPVIHCRTVRQAASVVSMQEVLPADVADNGFEVDGADIASAVAAAAALRSEPQCSRAACGDADVDGDSYDGVNGCVAKVRFRFMHRPEYLVTSAKLLVRDHTDGHTAGAGVVIWTDAAG